MATSTTDSTNPLSAVDPASWWRNWPFASWSGLVPQQLSQPINPGWSFGNIVSVTNVNSSAPEVEREVLAQHSYGRQLGKLMGAIAAVAEQLPAVADDPRIREFDALAADIEQIKQRARLPRIERLRAELEELKQSDPKAFEELRKTIVR